MKKLLSILLSALIIFSSCEKRKCKEQQEKDLATILVKLQQDLSNRNLTVAQIEEIKRRYDEKQKEILAECN